MLVVYPSAALSRLHATLVAGWPHRPESPSLFLREPFEAGLAEPRTSRVRVV